MKYIFMSLVMLASSVVNAASPSPSPAAPSTLTLTADNTLVLDTDVNSVSVSQLMSKALVMDSKLKSSEPIYLVLYTPGGSITDGLDFIHFMKALNRPVHTVTLWAASMGFQIVQGLGNRYITRYGTLMAHKARGTFQGEFPGQLDNRLNYFLAKLDELDNVAVARSKGKLTKQKFQQMYENEYWVDGFKALEPGLADEIVEVRCDQSLSGTREEMVNFFGFSIRVTLSKCPAITGPVAVEAMVHTNQGTIPINEFLKRGGTIGRLDVYPVGPVPVAMDTLNIETINKEVVNVTKRYNEKPGVIYTTIVIPPNYKN